MKKRNWIFLLGLIAVVFIIAQSCGGGLGESCQSSDSGCGTFRACCTATQCHYEYNGQNYNCDGTDCTDAANELVADMCGSYKSANESVDKTVEEMIEMTQQLSRGVCE
jgi:hypothetical protein